MPNAPATDKRSIRIPDDLWQDAKYTANQAGESVSEAIVRALRAYVSRGPRTPRATDGQMHCPTCRRLVSRRNGSVATTHKDLAGDWCPGGRI